MAYLEDEEIKRRVSLCLRILDYYKWLTNAYTLEFFTGNHWSLLPPCWQDFLPKTEPTEFSLWIRKGEQRKVWPLSLLAFRSLTRLASLERTTVTDLSVLEKVIGSSDCEKIQFVSPAEEMTSQAGQHKDLLHVFRKHVKPKKQHEIFRLAKVCSLCSKTTACLNLVDIGSGVGHLARVLHYGHDLNVVCLEAESDLSHSARKFDEDLMSAVSKKGENPKSPPRHAVCRLTPETDVDRFHEATEEVLEGSFGIVGLHTCGDLGPSTLRYFCASSRIKYLVSVGCCYMKMDLESNREGPRGYPLSSHVSSIKHNCLNYESREIACHAQEMYLERLDAEECEKLKVHCYRAALECILVAKDPKLKRCGLRSVKNAHTLSFERYAEEAVKRLEITLDSAEINAPEVAKCLSRWKQMYLFYTLRLMLAPVIETAILLDRLLYLREKGFPAVILPLFDPRLSARNLVIVAVKR